MLTLDNLSAALVAAEPEVWGDTVRASLPALCTLAVAGAKDHFRNQAGPDGKPWAPLAHPRPRGGDKPLRDRGLLMASLSASRTEFGLKLAASHAGVNIHNFGGTIKAKGNGFLAIPVSKEAARVGSPRKNGFPRPLFVIRGKSGTPLLVESKSKGRGKKKTNELVVHYVLKKSVTIPRRQFVGFSAETFARMSNLLVNNFKARLVAALEGRRQAAYAANPIIG